MQNASPSLLDPTQIFQRAFEEANDDLRVNITGGSITVTEAAISPEGGPLPAELKIAGGYDGSVVRVLSTDSSGHLNVVGSIATIQGTSPWVTSGSVAVVNNVTVVQPTGTNLHTVIDSGTVTANQGTSPWVVSGSVASIQSGTWNINNISGTVSLPTGAATEASLTKLTLSQGSTTSGEAGPLVQGAVTTAAPTYTTAQTSPLSLTTSGALRTDSSGSTQPISGTVTANQGTSPWVTSGSVAVVNAVAVTQSGNWSTRTQDGSGNAITSFLVNSNRGLNSSDLGYTHSEFVRNDYTATSVSTIAYVQLISSTANEYQELEVFDSSGQTLKIAFGGAGVEVDQFIVFPGGNGRIKKNVVQGTRISIKALSGIANLGEIDLNCYG